MRDTTEPNCTRRLKQIARNGSAVIEHDTNQRNVTTLLKPISRYDTTNFHDTAQSTSTIRLNEISWCDFAELSQGRRYDSANIQNTTQPNCTILLRQLSRYGWAELHDTMSPNWTIRLNRNSRHNEAKFHDTTQPNIWLGFKQIPWYDSADVSRDDSAKFYDTA